LKEEEPHQQRTTLKSPRIRVGVKDRNKTKARVRIGDKSVRFRVRVRIGGRISFKG
jgi:hypothetical protein